MRCVSNKYVFIDFEGRFRGKGWIEESEREWENEGEDEKEEKKDEVEEWKRRWGMKKGREGESNVTENERKCDDWDTKEETKK